MPCANCTARSGSGLHLLPADEDMGILLAGVLDEHRISFQRRQDIFVLATADEESEDAQLISLLRQVLSEPECQAVSVVTRDRPPQPLDQWWQFHETSWFDDALAHDRFETWFQPVVDTSAHRVFAHECLIRLNTGRMFTGGEIVEAARARGEFHAFDSYARRLAIRSAARQSAAYQIRDGRYFINFLPTSIYNPEFCLKSTLAALAESGLSPENVVFEIVEAHLMRESAHLARICDYLRSHGFAFALDDAGSGDHAVRAIRDLRPNYLKIDRSLVGNVEHPVCASAIRKLGEVAGQVGAVPIAMGVEKPETMENLWLLGVQCMQGYLFGRPSPRATRQSEGPASAESPRDDSGDFRMLDPDLVKLTRALAAEARRNQLIRYQ